MKFKNGKLLRCALRLDPTEMFHDACDGLWLIDAQTAADWISLSCLMEESLQADPDLAIFSLESTNAQLTAPLAHGLARCKAALFHRITADEIACGNLSEKGIAAAVLALGGTLDILEWSKDERFRRHFHPDYPNCGNTPVVPGIRFPVTDPEIHAATCSQYLDLAERMGSRVSQYKGDKERGWYLDDCGRWRELFGMEGTTRILEIGATDGVNTNALLDQLFPHPASEMHAIRYGAMDGGVDFFEENAAAGGHEGQIHLYEGEEVEILAWMISTEGFWESFDFMHLKPSREPLGALTAACQAWSLLKPGGVMVMDFSGRASLGEHSALATLTAFVRAAGAEQSTMAGGMMALRKGASR